MQKRLQRVEGLGADSKRLGERLGADRHDHELLEVDRVLGVDAAVDDVHHRHRQDVRVGAADVAIQRKAGLGGRRPGDRKRGAEDRVRAQVALVVGAVELDERCVHPALVGRVHPGERGGDRGVHVAHRREDALPAVAALVAVAQLDRLVCPGRRARRHGRPAAHSRVEDGLDLDGGVSPRVEDLVAVQRVDRAHGAG